MKIATLLLLPAMAMAGATKNLRNTEVEVEPDFMHRRQQSVMEEAAMWLEGPTQSSMLSFMEQAHQYEIDNPPSFLESVKHALGSVFACEWLLQATFTFGINNTAFPTGDVTDTVLTEACNALETLLVAQGSTDVYGCTFSTTAFDFVSLKTVDSSAGTVQFDVDWGVNTQNCGLESSYHAVLKAADYSAFVTLFKEYGNSISNAFLSAITEIKYDCPRDCDCLTR